MLLKVRDKTKAVSTTDAAIVVLCGADSGRIAQLSARFLTRFDPASVVTLNAAEIRHANDLADRLMAPSLFAPEIVIRVREAGDALAKMLKPLMGRDFGASRLLIEAGEIASSGALRKAVDADKNTAVLVCYRPEGAEINTEISAALTAHGISFAANVVDHLAQLVAPDSLAIENEIGKLALLIHPETRIALEDIAGLIGDQGENQLSELSNALLAGQRPTVARLATRLLEQGAEPIQLLRVAQRLFIRLHQALAQMQAGKSADAAMASLRPPVFYKEKPGFQTALRRASPAALEPALARLVEAERLCKSTGFPDRAVAAHALIEAANGAAR